MMCLEKKGYLMESLKPYLEKSCFSPNLNADTKARVLAELTDLFIANGDLSVEHRQAVIDALWERESKMSTGMQLGIAIPHAKIAQVDRLIVGIALSPQGIDFDSLDRQFSNIFIVTLSPMDEIGTHVRFLADISQRLSNDAVRDKLLKCETHAEMLRTLC